MIRRLLRAGAALLLYFGLATLIAEAVLLAYFGLRYHFDRTKLVQILAILQDVDLFAMKAAADRQEEISLEQVSYDQIMEERAKKVHHLELREQALKEELNSLQFRQRKLAQERMQYNQAKAAFTKQLAEMQAQATSAGMDDVRAKLEAIKAKQAKELLVEMLEKEEDNDVVTLLKGMPNVKAAKIIGEFKDDDLEKIGKVLRLIRAGMPLSGLIADAQKKLGEAQATRP